MARSLNQLTIFVSGPSTVEAEKAALRAVVGDINRITEKTHAVTLRVVGWPDDIRPGVNTDPQSEIDHQIGSDSDIYVGILGSRFGTPTIRGASGTEEEFEEALSRFHRDSSAIRLMFYFIRHAEDPFSLDMDQLHRVLDFRQRLGSRGVLYRDVRDTADFTKHFREHLHGLIIDEWRDNKWTETVASPSVLGPDISPQLISPPLAGPEPDSNIDQQEDEELGILEYVARFHDASTALAAVIQVICQETERVGHEIQARSAETDLLNAELEKQKAIGGSRTQQQFVNQAKSIVDHAAENLDEFTTEITPNVEQFKIHIRAFFDNMRSAFQAGAELGARDSAEDRQALAELIRTILQSRNYVMAFQSSISRVPAMTASFKRSRKRAAAILGEMVAEMSFSIQEAETLLDQMGGPPDPKTA